MLRESFLPKLDELHKYTSHAIKALDEPELLKAGFDTVAFLCKVFPEHYGKQLGEILPYLIQCLNDTNFSKENKPIIFLTIGDVALFYPNMIIANIGEIFRLYEMAYLAVKTLYDTKQPENIEYSEILKENLIDSLVCIIHGAVYSDEAQGQKNEILNL